MTNYYLRADSEETLWNKLVEAGAAKTYDVKNQEGNIVETRYVLEQEYNIDIIGIIYKPTGNVIQQLETNGTMIEVPEIEELSGFHANLRGPVNLSEKIEYKSYVPTEEELIDSSFVLPEPEKIIKPSPISDILVYPKNPIRVWF
jgi:phosphoribosylformylglycinamidine (FGAM) synthase-like amidotransferase family enzyme